MCTQHRLECLGQFDVGKMEGGERHEAPATERQNVDRDLLDIPQMVLIQNLPSFTDASGCPECQRMGDPPTANSGNSSAVDPARSAMSPTVPSRSERPKVTGSRA